MGTNALTIKTLRPSRTQQRKLKHTRRQPLTIKKNTTPTEKKIRYDNLTQTQKKRKPNRQRKQHHTNETKFRLTREENERRRQRRGTETEVSPGRGLNELSPHTSARGEADSPLACYFNNMQGGGRLI